MSLYSVGIDNKLGRGSRFFEKADCRSDSDSWEPIVRIRAGRNIGTGRSGRRQSLADAFIHISGRQHVAAQIGTMCLSECGRKITGSSHL